MKTMIRFTFPVLVLSVLLAAAFSLGGCEILGGLIGDNDEGIDLIEGLLEEEGLLEDELGSGGTGGSGGTSGGTGDTGGTGGTGGTSGGSGGTSGGTQSQAGTFQIRITGIASNTVRNFYLWEAGTPVPDSKNTIAARSLNPNIIDEYEDVVVISESVDGYTYEFYMHSIEEGSPPGTLYTGGSGYYDIGINFEGGGVEGGDRTEVVSYYYLNEDALNVLSYVVFSPQEEQHPAYVADNYFHIKITGITPNVVGNFYLWETGTLVPNGGSMLAGRILDFDTVAGYEDVISGNDYEFYMHSMEGDPTAPDALYAGTSGYYDIGIGFGYLGVGAMRVDIAKNVWLNVNTLNTIPFSQFETIPE